MSNHEFEDEAQRLDWILSELRAATRLLAESQMNRFGTSR